MLYTTKEEIYKHYKRMDGDEKTKIKILSELNLVPEKYIREVIKEMRYKEVEKSTYDADSNPYCEAKPQKRYLPAAVLDTIYAEIDSLDREIKILEDELKEKHKQYKDLCSFLGAQIGE